MESNWRWGVYEMGFAGTDWKYAARGNGLWTGYWIVQTGQLTGAGAVFQDVGPGLLPVLQFVVYFYPTGPHFPGPYTVDPD